MANKLPTEFNNDPRERELAEQELGSNPVNALNDVVTGVSDHLKNQDENAFKDFHNMRIKRMEGKPEIYGTDTSEDTSRTSYNALGTTMDMGSASGGLKNVAKTVGSVKQLFPKLRQKFKDTILERELPKFNPEVDASPIFTGERVIKDNPFDVVVAEAKELPSRIKERLSKATQSSTPEAIEGRLGQEADKVDRFLPTFASNPDEQYINHLKNKASEVTRTQSLPYQRLRERVK